MGKLKEKLIKKLYGRCAKCPFFYQDTTCYEDWDERCMKHEWEHDEKLCFNMFLPICILKIRYKIFEKLEDIKYKRYDVRMKRNCAKCKLKDNGCHWEECALVDQR